MPVYSSQFRPAPLPRLSVFAHQVPQSEPFAPDFPAFIDATTSQVVTRAAVRADSLRLARGLRNLDKVGGLGLHKGSTVTVFSPNTVFYPIVVLATAAAGIRSAFANSGYTERELLHVIKDSRSSHVLTHFSLLPKVMLAFVEMGISPEDAKRRVVIISPKNTVPSAILQAGWITCDDLVPGTNVLPEDFSNENSDETVYIYYSSGTTGNSKGVEVSHFNTTSVLEQLHVAWSYYKHGRDVILGVAPFFHILGGFIVLLSSYKLGLPLVIHSGFNPELILSSIQRHRITAAIVPPPIVNFLAKHPLVDKFDVSSLRFLVVGGAPLRPALVNETTRRLDSRGVHVVICQAMGLTETSGCTHVVPPARSKEKIGSVGLLLPNMEARLVDDSENDVADGEAGELWVRGPNIMKGYVENSEANKNTITPDGWLKTGDIVTIDSEGFYAVVDRKKELIKYKAFQVPPAELEAVLTTHPAIADAAVIGIYSEKDATELPRAFIVPKDPDILKQKDHGRFIIDIHQWLLPRVAYYKQLRGGIVITETIPRTPVGKILRRNLRDASKL